jgi:GeoRSP system SPASM domain protein
MQRLEIGGDCFQLGKAERQELAGRLREVGNLDKMRVTIHDPFLWRVFFQAVSFPNGSCQAANTMLHIAANGDVYPCPSLPVRLGSLATTPLSVIAVSPEKMNLRARLVSPPQGCLACAEVSNCLGGCRGRGYCVTDSWDEPDPGCGE